MKLFRSLEEPIPEIRRGAVSIGNFDGVHRGHARIVERLTAMARRLGGPAVVFTFDPHPVRLLRPEAAPPPLTWTERKAELLEQLGVDAMIAFPTDASLLSLSPEAFFQQLVLNQLAARGMVEGPNFYFGRDRAGTIDLLRRLCDQSHIALEVVPPLEIAGQIVSSSRIREAIRRGDVASARAMLTRPYRIRGMVTHGERRGAKIGFPTANLEAIDTLVPARGVYAGRAGVDGRWNPAAIHLGPNPTFGEQSTKFEVHIIGHQSPLYGRVLEVDFLDRLRDIQRFDSVDDLKRQLADDVAAARSIAEAAQSSGTG